MKLFTLTLGTFVFAFASSIASAATLAAVDSQSCQKRRGNDQPFILVLKKGEDLSSVIVNCANAAHLYGAALTGLGAVESPTLSYFNHDTKKYQQKTFPGNLELASLTGNIAELEGKRVTHIHVALSDDQYQMFGGHLKDATVGATAEITVTPLQGKLKKTMDTNAGLALLSTTE